MKEINLDLIKVNHLHNLLLWEPPKRRKLIDVIQKIGYVQLDAVYTIARSQDIVLHTRMTNYNEKDLLKSYKKLKIFEGWAHAKCVLPVSEFPYYYSAMLQRRSVKRPWHKFVDKLPKLPEQVFQQIKEEGPLGISDIKVDENFPKSTGWNSPQKRVADYLETQGYIIGLHDVNFKLQYDTVEKVMGELPENTPNSLQCFWQSIKTSINAIGITPLHRLLHYKYDQSQFIYKKKKMNPRKLIKMAVEKGKLIEMEIANHKYYSNQEKYDQIFDMPMLGEKEWSVFLLSPFDNVLWSRESLLAEYNFNYKMEIYVPEKKRKYGYYVVPILWGPNFMGRVSLQHDRKEKTLSFTHWYWENDVVLKTQFIEELAKSISRFATFHSVKKVELGNIKKEKLLKDMLQF